MSTATTVVVVVVFAAVLVGFSGVALYLRNPFVTDNLAAYGVPERWWPWLATAKSLGAVGLLVGLAETWVGLAAATALVAYFTGAVVTVLRARAFGHVPYPIVYATPVIAAGVLMASV